MIIVFLSGRWVYDLELSFGCSSYERSIDALVLITGHDVVL
jgi:hypothetical protein